MGIVSSNPPPQLLFTSGQPTLEAWFAIKKSAVEKGVVLNDAGRNAGPCSGND